jgi:tetratricopeptide (TPR) repeat protein
MRISRCCVVAVLLLLVVLVLARPASARCGMHGHSPRHGGGGGYGGIWAAEAAWQAWLAREKQAEALRRLKNAEQQYAGAIKAQQEGKTWLAATLYMRVALARPKNRHSAQAKQALAAMAVEGRSEMKKADELLEKGEIEEAFKQLDALASGYANVPRFNHEIAEHVQKLHHDPKYQAVLNEPRAAALVDEAQKNEANGEYCCAFIAYEEAAKLLPAPSAQRAEERWTAMKQDPKIVADAETCRKLRDCLHMFHVAELLEKSSPGKAEEMFKKILARSPSSSEVHRCASEEIAKLHGHGKKAKDS